jgi:putative tryptophan/tyrosine transport system substrate-binding protein
MRRREFITGIGATAVWPLAARGQQLATPVIGWLDMRTGRPPREWVEGFRRGLADVSFSQGRDVTVEYHTTDSGCRRLSLIWYAEGRRRSSHLTAVRYWL